MAVDDARHQVFARCIHYRCICRSADGFTDRGNLTVFNQHAPVRDRSLCDGEHRCISNQDCFGSGKPGGQHGANGKSQKAAHQFVPPSSTCSIEAFVFFAAGGCCASFDGRNCFPSMNTYSMVALSSNASPLVTTRFAIFPFSMLPSRSATPYISAAFKVSARTAASRGKPASMAFFTAFF